MATCGHCKQPGQTIGHIRTCRQAGSVATKQLPDLTPGNVVTLSSADGYWHVVRPNTEDARRYLVEQLLPGSRMGAEAYVHAREVELVFPSAQAAKDYDMALRDEATKRQTRETLHGDPNYCRGCAKGWAGAKWHRDGCPVIAAREAKVAPVPGDYQSEAATRSPWEAIDALRGEVKPHLHRKIRNAQVGHFALRTEGVVKFYRVKLVTTGNWAGKVFVEAQASDDFHPVRSPETLTQVLTGILADPHAAEELYGQELGQCYRCNRTLTDETSRALGIGPECRSKL